MSNKGCLGLSNERLDVTLGRDWADPGVLSGNCLIGYQAGMNVQQTQNTTVGSGTGGFNTFIGYQAANAVTTGDSNVAVGYQAGNALTTGYQNVMVGYLAGGQISTGYQNVAIGYKVLGGTATTGIQNTGVGYAAGDNNTGSSNVFIGYETGVSSGSAADSVMIGASAGFSCSNGGDVLIGYAANSNATGGGSCVAVGYQVGQTNSSAGSIFVGYKAGNGNTSGINTFVGYQAGYTSTSANATSTGTKQTCIGYNTGQNTSSQLNNITLLGDGVQAGASGVVAIGIDHAGTSASSSTQDEIKLGTAIQTVNMPGGIKGQVVTKTTTYAMNAYDFTVLGNASSGFTVTLPAPTAGAIYVVKNINTGTVTLSHNASETIDGASSISIATQYESVIVTSDGTNWFVISANAASVL